MPKPSKLRLLLILVVLIAGAMLAFVPQTKALAATYPKPSWWNGDTCDSTHFNASGQTAYLLTTWNGIQVCGYGPNQTIPGSNPPTNGADVAVTFPGGHGEFEWECTELVKRYLYIVYGAPAIAADGDQVVANYASTYSTLFRSITNDGNTHKFPSVGDVISYSGVHTAIITVVSITDQTNGNATLSLIEQNADPHGTTTQQFVGWKIKGGIDDPNDQKSDTVTARLTARQWSDISPSGTTKDQINSVAASSTTSVWAAGWEQPSGSNKTPVTYYNNGTGWTKYLPTAQGSGNNWLYGIASSSSGDTWTVGQDYNYPHDETLAYHWNGSSWTHVTSDNPSATQENSLNGVAIDSAGGIWAVGDYYDGSHNQPMVEKWNGTKFAQQTISPQSTCLYGGQLNSVAFSSSTNGWAVGFVNCATTSYHVIYHYDGSSWSPTVGTISGAKLLSVTAISDTEAWAVGRQGVNQTPLILHYTSANGWQEDTSFNNYYPSGAALNSVASDSQSDVWIVGYWYNSLSQYKPYTMRYNGNNWAQFDTPTVSGSANLQGVAVNSNDAWAGGSFGAPNSNTVPPLVYHYGFL